MLARSIVCALLSVSCAPSAPARVDAPGAPAVIGPAMDVAAPAAFAARSAGWQASLPSFDVSVSPGAIELSAGDSGVRFSTIGEGAPFERAPDGSLVRAAGSMRERIRIRGDSIEQAWEIDERPSAALTIEVEVEGATYESTDAAGARFRAPGGALVRYGHGTLVGADGARVPVPSTWSGRAIVLALDAEALDAVRYPAVLDPILGVETEISAVHESPPWGDQEGPNAVALGSGFLAAWRDSRRSYDLTTWTDQPLYATRVDADGTVRDPRGILVTTDRAYDFALVGGATRCAVFWPASRSGAGGLHVAFVGADGSVSASREIASLSSVWGTRVEAVPLGSGYLVAWRRSGNVQTVLVASDGAPGAVEDTGVSASTWQLASRGDSALLLAVDAAESHRVVRIASDGTPSAPATLATSIGAEIRDARLVASGAGYLVVWHHEWVEIGLLHADLWAQALDASGAAAGAPANVVPDATPVDDLLDLEPSGSAHVLAWYGGVGDGLRAVRLGLDGGLLEPLPASRLASFGFYSADVAANAGAHLVVSEGHDVDADVFATLLFFDPARVDPPYPYIPLQRVPSSQRSYQITASRSHYTVAFGDTRTVIATGNANVYAARFAADGTPLDPDGIQLSPDGAQFVAGVTDVDGTITAMWNASPDYTDARRRRADGTFADATPVHVRDDLSATGARSVTFGSTVWIAADDLTLIYAPSATGYWASSIYGRYATVAIEGDDADVDCGPTHCLAVSRTSADTRGRLRTSSGWGASFRIGAAGGSPRVAWDGSQYVVAWAGSVASVLPDGTVGTPAPGVGIAVDDLVFDGRYVLGVGAEFGPVRGVFLDGTSVVDGPFTIDEERSNPRVIAASTGDGRSLVLYQQNDPAMEYSARVRARLVASGAPLPPRCADDTECSAAGACTRGVCGADGRCTTEGVAGCCVEDADCDDGDPCTMDVCSAGACDRSPVCADAGMDAGLATIDAGATDAAAPEPDAGTAERDAGAPADAGSPADPDASTDRDAGSAIDAGQDAGGAVVDEGAGCGCSVPARRDPPLAWLVLALALPLRRLTRRSR